MAPQGRHPRESEAALTELMMPHHANIMGNVFGGHILALVDRVAAVAAIRHSHRACVTVSVDKVDFREPIVNLFARRLLASGEGDAAWPADSTAAPAWRYFV